MDKLPPDHKARWFAGSALNTGDQSMASVMSTALSRLNAFLDSELEQILCFDTAIDAERFCNTKSALFIVLPEEDTTKYFMASLAVQQLYREMLAVADEQWGNSKTGSCFFLIRSGQYLKLNHWKWHLVLSDHKSVPLLRSYRVLPRCRKTMEKRALKL